jgi:ribonuclease HI
MNDLIDLQTIAYKGERAASRRLARTHGLSDEQALRRTLELAAGQAGLPALVAGRLALREAESARAAAREQVRASARAEREARDQGGPGGGPNAWRAWFDGSARPNPGRCAIGVLLCGPDGARVELSRPAGVGDSSAAEYRALIALLEAALERGADDLTIHGDSQVVIGDVTGPDAHAAPVLRAYRDSARALLARIGRVSLRWVPRHKNQIADALSQRALPSTSLSETETETDAHDEGSRRA